jgi:hypothetical protein
MGDPISSTIAAIFNGIDMAVNTVADTVDKHAGNLASDPCFWRNDLLHNITVGLPVFQKAAADAWSLALGVTQMGGQAVLSARFSAGYTYSGRKFNHDTVQKFGNYLLGQGVPVFPFGTPPEVMMTQPWVRRGIPDNNYDIPLPGFPGVGFRAGKLAGPQIRQDWNSWNVNMTLTIEPRGKVRKYKGSTGWRAIIGLLTGHSAPAWAPGVPILENSYIWQVENKKAIIQAFLAEATIRCAEVQTAPPAPEGAGVGGLVGVGAILAVLSLL